MKRNGDLYHKVILNAWAPRSAITLGHWTFVRGNYCPARLRRHEYRHVWQWRRAGYVGFAALYLLEFAFRILAEVIFTFTSGREWRGLVDRAYRAISWEKDAYDYGNNRDDLLFDDILYKTTDNRA